MYVRSSRAGGRSNSSNITVVVLVFVEGIAHHIYLSTDAMVCCACNLTIELKRNSTCTADRTETHII